MNKFYLIIITTEDAQEVPEVYAHDTYEGALTQFYSTFVSKMPYDTVKAVYCEIKNSAGTAVKVERFSREVPDEVAP